MRGVGEGGEKKEGIFIIHFPIDTKKLQTHTFSFQDLSCQPVQYCHELHQRVQSLCVCLLLDNTLLHKDVSEAVLLEELYLLIPVQALHSSSPNHKPLWQKESLENRTLLSVKQRGRRLSLV